MSDLTPAVDRPSMGQCAALACLMEATAPKPGNVHRGADFEDLTYGDFLVAATVIAPAMNRAGQQRVGQTVVEAVTATRQATGTNVNLGTVLLFAPLAAASARGPIQQCIARILAEMDRDDCRDVYQSIRVAQPGGLGHVETADVHGEAPSDLLIAMRLASDRDLVARQYVNDFQQVLGLVVPWLEAGLNRGWSSSQAIVHAYLRLMSEFPDSLIARKCGLDVARKSAAAAAAVLAAGQPGEQNYEERLADLDFWLRADHHRRNPGTSADLVAAGLFVALREGIIKAPYRLAY
jgi:triphosphoribosyl-dephospho-CoA synthase